MSKQTPEQLAEQYAENYKLNVPAKSAAYDGFLAGYKASDNRLNQVIERLQEIRRKDTHQIPCPDGIEGCAVYHYKIGNIGRIATEALQEILKDKK